jgi:hypothetical protein
MAGIGLVVPEGVALLSAAGALVPFDEGTIDGIDEMWPTISQTAAPALDFQMRLWAMLDNQTIVIAPTPDNTYTVYVTGLFQPASLSLSNESTYLATTYPELLTAACMVFLLGALQHNFGAQSDDPRSSVSWEAQYALLMSGVKDEEMRRRGMLPDVPKMAMPARPA